MHSVLDTHIESIDKQRLSANQLVVTYLQQSSAPSWFGVSDRSPEEMVSRAQDLWDYLGDFA